MTGKAELGQGLKTAFIQVAAEETGAGARLDTPRRHRRYRADPGRRLYRRQPLDAGFQPPRSGTPRGPARGPCSSTPPGAVSACRRTLANRRRRGGRAPDGRRLPLAEVAPEVELDAPVPERVSLRDPATYTLVGQPLPRVDIPAKVAGAAAYVQDIRAPGHGPCADRAPASPRRPARERRRGRGRLPPRVIRVHRDGSFLAVLAEREYAAVTAMRALARVAVWQGGTPVPEPDALFSDLAGMRRSGRSSTRPASMRRCRRDAGSPRSTVRRYQMHGSIGPSCAVAEFDGSRLTVWSHAQGMFPLRKALAEMLSLPEEQVRCIHVEGSGCYGHNGADDAAGDAALLARALPGRPVRVQYTREQEHLWSPMAARLMTEASAVLGPDGRIADWDYAVRSPTHLTRPPGAGPVALGPDAGDAFCRPSPRRRCRSPRAAATATPSRSIVCPGPGGARLLVSDMPLRVSALRSLGALHERVLDREFLRRTRESGGRRSGRVPLEASRRSAGPRRDRGRRLPLRLGAGAPEGPRRRLRLRALQEPRGLLRARRRGGGDARERPGPAGAGASCGRCRPGRQPPTTASRDQIEGGIIQAMSWSLEFEAVAHDAEGPTSRDWSTYPIARFPDIPERLDVHLIDRPGQSFQPSLGAGEVAQGPTAAGSAMRSGGRRGCACANCRCDRRW